MSPISQVEAALAFESAGMVDPAGVHSPRTAAMAGRCFSLEFPQGSAVISVGEEGGALWCYALAGRGRDLTRKADAVLCQIARLSGFRTIGFQTARPGLVRRCRALGYLVTDVVGVGFKMEKAVP